MSTCDSILMSRSIHQPWHLMNTIVAPSTMNNSFSISSPWSFSDAADVIMNTTITEQATFQLTKFNSTLVLQSAIHLLNGLLPSFLSESIFFHILSMFVQVLFANQLVTSSIGLVVLAQIGSFLSNKFNDLYLWLEEMFCYSFVIDKNSGYLIYDAMITWLSQVDYFKDAKHLDIFYDTSTRESESDMDYKLIPTDGKYSFKFKGYTIYFSRDTSKEKLQITKSLTLSVYSPNGRSILKSIVDEAVKCHTQYEDTENTTLYNYNAVYGRWENICKRPCRTFDSVYLDEGVKSLFLKDLERFLSNKKFYLENQLSYKRGYCLYGKPGSGKTSLILATAAHIKCPVYILNLNQPEMSDTAIMDAFSTIPTRCIVALEDIDSAFNENRKSTGEISNKLSFSGLLNSLDGVNSYSETPKLIFMTTNHIERLDRALVRPGRVDYKVKFENATPDQIQQISFKFLKNLELAQALSKHKGLQNMTISEIQTFLMRFIDTETHSTILDQVASYVTEIESLKKDQNV